MPFCCVLASSFLLDRRPITGLWKILHCIFIRDSSSNVLNEDRLTSTTYLVCAVPLCRLIVCTVRSATGKTRGDYWRQPGRSHLYGHRLLSLGCLMQNSTTGSTWLIAECRPINNQLQGELRPTGPGLFVHGAGPCALEQLWTRDGRGGRAAAQTFSMALVLWSGRHVPTTH